MSTQLKQLSQLKDLNPKGRAEWCINYLTVQNQNIAFSDAKGILIKDSDILSQIQDNIFSTEGLNSYINSKTYAALSNKKQKSIAEWCIEQLHKTGVCISKGAKLNKVENSEPYWCDSNIELNADGTTTHNDL